MVAATEEPSRRSRLPSPADKLTAPSHSRRSLHNFSFPPTLSWGNQRLLRCVNLTDSNSNGNLTAGNHTSDESDPKSKPKKIVEHQAELSSHARPWNLRTRRANPNRISNLNPNPSPNLNRSLLPPPLPPPSPSSKLSPPSPTLLNVVKKGNSVKSGGSEGGRCNFAVALKREEIEEDFLKMKGTKPPRRPKKRAKYIQRQIDLLFPGLWLSDITPESYKIDVEKS